MRAAAASYEARNGTRPAQRRGRSRRMSGSGDGLRRCRVCRRGDGEPASAVFGHVVAEDLMLAFVRVEVERLVAVGDLSVSADPAGHPEQSWPDRATGYGFAGGQNGWPG